MNDQPKQEVPEINSSPEIPRGWGVALSPVSDMSEFEPKPYTPVPLESSDVASVAHVAEQAQPPTFIPPVEPSAQSDAFTDADIARRMPKLRVVERVPILKLYLVVVVISLLITLVQMGMAGMMGFALFLSFLSPLFFVTIALPFLLSASTTIFLFRTKSAKAATIVLTILLVLGALSLLYSAYRATLLAIGGFSIGSSLFGFLISGLLLYFLYRTRQATATEDRRAISSWAA